MVFFGSWEVGGMKKKNAYLVYSFGCHREVLTAPLKAEGGKRKHKPNSMLILIIVLLELYVWNIMLTLAMKKNKIVCSSS